MIRRWAAVAPALAAALSTAYVLLILRGGPRIIDATAYFLEAKLLSQGLWALPLDGPEHAALGRFLLRTPSAEAAVIFPPGYPALLALGFAIGAPMAIGPALAAALTFATMRLTDELLRLLPEARSRQAWVAMAGILSATCAALRYHTADTMSHGLAALLVTVGAVALLRLRRAPTTAAALTLGLAGGWLVATRPVSALALAVAAVLTLGWRAAPPARGRTFAAMGLGCLPGLALWALYQHHATGSWSGTAQGAYYALSDGPPGCFRYGFGAGIGCLGEHGDFVRHNLPDGYGAYPTLATSARRLKMHVSDAFSFAPSFALVPAGMILAWPRARGVALLPLLLLLAYAPFYFDGNYPGGGARLLAEALPVEQALGIVACARLAERYRLSVPQVGGGLLALAALGLVTYLGADHLQLRDREGGRPMFVRPAPAGLVFVDTDHGYLLGRALHGQVVRLKGDDHDRLVWEQRGRPPAWRYRHPTRFDESPRFEPLVFPARPGPRTIEAASLWPPRAQEGGWAWPAYVGGTCAEAGRLLRLRAGGRASVTLDLPALGAGQLRIRTLHSEGADATLTLASSHGPIRRWRLIAEEGCVAHGPVDVASGDDLTLTLETSRSSSPAQVIGVDTLSFIQKR